MEFIAREKKIENENISYGTVKKLSGIQLGKIKYITAVFQLFFVKL